jgi:hypothetical protein
MGEFDKSVFIHYGAEKDFGVYLLEQFGYRDYTPVRPGLNVVNYFRGVPIEDQVAPYGVVYFQLENPGQQPVQMSFKGTTVARLTPADPPSGQYAWYSNRGDNSNFTLTRAFDLTEVDRATLKFQVWYELEQFYD